MSLTAWTDPFFEFGIDPVKEIRRIERELERIDRDLLGEFRVRRGVQGKEKWIPLLDVKESPNEMVILMDLPGVKRENLHITLQNEWLRVKGKRADQDIFELEGHPSEGGKVEGGKMKEMEGQERGIGVGIEGGKVEGGKKEPIKESEKKEPGLESKEKGIERKEGGLESSKLEGGKVECGKVECEKKEGKKGEEVGKGKEKKSELKLRIQERPMGKFNRRIPVPKGDFFFSFGLLLILFVFSFRPN
jgi:HSP20 family molecular chaperone IbpA